MLDPGAHDLGPLHLRAPSAPEIEALAVWLAGIEPYRTLGQTKTMLRRYFRRSDPALARWAIQFDGRLAGVIALREPWLNGAYLEALAVAEPLRGKGFGRRLVDWAASQAGANLWVCVSGFNAPARAFYAACGFAEAAVLPGLMLPGLDELLLRRRT